MATRFYLPSSGTPGISPSIDAGWETTHSLVRYKAVTTKISSTMTTIARTADGSSADQDICFVQYISNPIAGQTISAQTLKFQMRQLETATSANLFTAIGVRVLSGDGGTVRGTVLAVSRDGLELATSLTNRQFSATTTQVVAQDGDVIVIEVGYGGDPSPASARHNGSISIGDDSGTDLGENDTDTAAYNPWVQFTNDITFEAPNAMYSKDITFGVPTIDKPVLVQNAIVSKDLFFGVPTIDKPTLEQASNDLTAKDITSGVPTIDKATCNQAGSYTDYQIDDNDYLIPEMSHAGIICDSNDNLYLFLKPTSNGRYLACMKSSNGGQTWAEVDSSNRPDSNGLVWASICNVAIVQDGSQIHIATFHTDSHVAYHRFNMSDNASPDTWDVTDVSIMGFTDTGGEGGVSLVMQSDGDLLVVSNGQNERDFTGSESVVYHYSQNGGSTWTSDQTLSNTDNDNIGGFACVGESNKIHMTWKGEGALNYYHQSLSDVTGTPTTKEDLSDYTVADTPNYGHAQLVYVDNDGDETIVFAGLNSTFYPRSTKVINDGTPSASEQIINNTVFRSMFGTSSAHYAAMSLCSQGKSLYFVFADTTDQDIYLVRNTDLGGWGSAEEIIDGTTAEFLSSGIYVRDGYYRLGIFWQITTTYETRFVEVTLGSATVDNDLVAKDLYAAAPTIDKPILVQNALVSKDITSGVPTVDKPTVSHAQFDLVSKDITAGVPTIDKATLVLTQAIISKDLRSGVPTIDKPDLIQNALVSKDTTFGAPTIDKATLAQIFALVPKDLTGGMPTIDKGTLAQIFALTSKDIASGIPTIDKGTLGQKFDLTSKDITSGVPTIDKPALVQNALVSKDIRSGVPTIDKPTANQAAAGNDLAAKDITLGVPTIDKPTLVLTQDIVSKDITFGIPTVDKPTLVQNALVSKDVTSAAPTIDKTTLAQLFGLTANDITAGVPTIDKPSLVQNALVSKDVTAAAPTVEKSTLAQLGINEMLAQDIAFGLPTIDKPTLTLVQAITSKDVVGTPPTIDKPSIGLAQAIVAKDAVAGIPTIDEATLAQLFGLTANDVFGGIATIDKPTAGQTLALEAEDILGSPATVDKATLAQLFGLESKDVLLGTPTIDKPMMLDESELWAKDITLGIPTITVGDFGMWWYTPTARVVSISEEDRTYTVLADGRLYIVPFENRTLTVLDRS